MRTVMNLFADGEREIVEMHVSTFDGNRISPPQRDGARVLARPRAGE